jgi:hypothetical protein
LAELAHTDGIASLVLGPGEGGQQHAGQNSDDRNYDKQFNQRKRMAKTAPARRFSPPAAEGLVLISIKQCFHALSFLGYFDQLLS